MITLLRDRDQDDDDRMCTTLGEDSLLRVYTRRIKTNITCCVIQYSTQGTSNPYDLKFKYYCYFPRKNVHDRVCKRTRLQILHCIPLSP